MQEIIKYEVKSRKAKINIFVLIHEFYSYDPEIAYKFNTVMPLIPTH